MRVIPILSKFADLKAHGIVNSRPGLNQMQKRHGFPRPHWVPGLGKVWARKEIEDWFRAQGIELTSGEPDMLSLVKAPDVTPERMQQAGECQAPAQAITLTYCGTAPGGQRPSRAARVNFKRK